MTELGKQSPSVMIQIIKENLLDHHISATALCMHSPDQLGEVPSEDSGLEPWQDEPRGPPRSAHAQSHET